MKQIFERLEAKHIVVILTSVGGLILAFYLVYTSSTAAAENLEHSQETNDKFIAAVERITDKGNEAIKEVNKEFVQALDRNTNAIQGLEKAMYRNPNIQR